MEGEFDMAAGLAEISDSLFDSGDLGGGSSSEGGANDDLDLGESGDKSPGNGRQQADTASVAGKPAAVGNPNGDTGGKPAVGNPADAPPVGGTPAPGPLDLPKTWKQDEAIKAAWAGVDPVIKAEVARREEAMFKGLETYKSDAEDGRVFQKVFEPYEQAFRANNVNPVALTQGLLQSHYALSYGSSEQKVAMFRHLAEAYGVDLQVASAEQPYVDPEVQRLRRENQALQSQQRRAQEESAANLHSTMETQLKTFEADPKNVHFLEVIDQMIPLIQTGDSLEEAYQKAIWVNPKTRALEVARLNKEDASRKAQEEKDRVAAARRATSVNVKTSAKSGSATAPVGSMDDTMAETLAEIRGRG